MQQGEEKGCFHLPAACMQPATKWRQPFFFLGVIMPWEVTLILLFFAAVVLYFIIVRFIGWLLEAPRRKFFRQRKVK